MSVDGNERPVPQMMRTAPPAPLGPVVDVYDPPEPPPYEPPAPPPLDGDP